MNDEQRPPLESISSTLNIGYELKRRLEVVAAGEQMDARCLGRRVIRAAVEEREGDIAAGE